MASRRWWPVRELPYGWISGGKPDDRVQERGLNTSGSRSLCSAIRVGLAQRLKPQDIVYGPDEEVGPAPEAARLRDRGVGFEWVGVRLPPFPFWQVHVGVVVNEFAGSARVGLHASLENVSAQRLLHQWETGLTRWGLERSLSELAEEEQWNGPFRDCGREEDVEELCREAVELAEWARARTGNRPSGKG